MLDKILSKPCCFVLLGAVILTGYVYQSLMIEKFNHAKTEAEFAEFRASINEAGKKLAIAQAKSLHQKQIAISESNDKNLEELMDANEIIDDLLDDLSSGRRRVFVTAEKGSDNGGRKMPKTTTTGRMVDEKERCELNKEDARAIFEFAGYGDKTAVMLSACQEYVREVRESE